MIVSITIKNWMSFKDKTFFTMEAGKEKSSRSTLADFKRFRIKLLPIAAISDQMVPANLISLKQFHSYSVC